jgi:hypothetical protein
LSFSRRATSVSVRPAAAPCKDFFHGDMIAVMKSLRHPVVLVALLGGPCSPSPRPYPQLPLPGHPLWRQSNALPAPAGQENPITLEEGSGVLGPGTEIAYRVQAEVITVGEAANRPKASEPERVSRELAAQQEHTLAPDEMNIKNQR